MRPRFFVSLVALAFLAALVGLVVLAVWDVPVTQTKVEKPAETAAPASP